MKTGMSERQSYYEVLGVPREADERQIKRAYFALIRKHPPETDPEQFQKIREAYEVLSRSESRREYDAFGVMQRQRAEVDAALSAGQEAMQAREWKRACTHYEEVLRLAPDLHFARDLYGMALLHGGLGDKALEQFDALVRAQPMNPNYHLHRGYALGDRKQFELALAALREAERLDGNDPRIPLAICDLAEVQQRWDDALVALTRAEERAERDEFGDFVFGMRRIEIEFKRDRVDRAEQALDELFAKLPPKEGARRHAATRLAALAAEMFARKRISFGNRLLGRARQLDPTRAWLAYQYPVCARVAVEALPAKTQERISAFARERPADKIEGAAGRIKARAGLAWIGMLVGAVGGMAAPHRWDGGEQAAYSLFIIAVSVAAALTVRALVRLQQSRFGLFTAVLPPYLVEVDCDDVRVWPLMNLNDGKLTHHRVNGVYSGSVAELLFDDRKCKVEIHGRERAEKWMAYLFDARRRVLGAMAKGQLERANFWDLVPPEQLRPDAGRQRSKVDTDRMLRWGFVGAGVGIVFAVAALRVNDASISGPKYSQPMVAETTYSRPVYVPQPPPVYAPPAFPSPPPPPSFGAPPAYRPTYVPPAPVYGVPAAPNYGVPAAPSYGAPSYGVPAPPNPFGR
jgi:curved DNA-binding protein CbpA